MIRERFNENPVDKILTFSEYMGMVQEEPLILHYTAQKLSFEHWTEHLYYFYAMVSKKPPDYKFKGDFNVLKRAVYYSLKNSGFVEQSNEVLNCNNEEELNSIIIKQYTDETPLYRRANKELRTCHNIQNESKVSEEYLKKHSSPFAAWILQLNTAIRREKEYRHIAYRGAQLKQNEIDEYKENEIIIWAPFISASKLRTQCLEGNTIFEIGFEGALSEHDKRFARDISHLSVFPDEGEVIFPIACSYRVNYKKCDHGKTIIGLSAVDSN